MERWLEPVDDGTPCGPNLEYDGAYLELERISTGRPEQQIGKTVVAAVEPDWRAVERKAFELFESTRDLRIAAHLTRAWLRLRGFAGLADGLALLHGFVDRYWDTVHPALDPNDGNDPTMRVNILSGLSDPQTVLTWIRTAPLVASRAVGRYTLRDVLVATGEMSPPPGQDGTPAPMTTIEAAFASADVGDLEATAKAARAASKSALEIEQTVSERAGPKHRPDLEKVRSLLDQAAKFVEQRLAQRGVGVPSNGAESTDGAAAQPGNGAAGTAATAAPKLSGEVHSREDVVKALDKIIEYYQRNEPSSPIPLLVRRCKRLVHMSFLEIVRDIAPDGMSQVEALRGRTDEEGSES